MERRPTIGKASGKPKEADAVAAVVAVVGPPPTTRRHAKVSATEWILYAVVRRLQFLLGVGVYPRWHMMVRPLERGFNPSPLARRFGVTLQAQL